MVVLGTQKEGLLHPKVLMYILALIFAQLVVIVTVLEFMRKPWEGVEIELEKAMDLQQNKLFEDSISAMVLSQHGTAEPERNSSGGDGGTRADKIDETKQLLLGA